MMNKLLQDRFPIKFLKDLGMQLPTTKHKNRAHYALFECKHCDAPFKAKVSEVRNYTTTCCSFDCACKDFKETNKHIVPTDEYYSQAINVYFTHEFKTKPNKTNLLSLNDLLTMYYKTRNKIKQFYNDDLVQTIKNYNYPKLKSKYEVAYVYYYRNSASDLGNVCQFVSKVLLDAAQKAGLVEEDNVNYCHRECMYVGGLDKANPRVEIFIRPYLEEKETND